MPDRMAKMTADAVATSAHPARATRAQLPNVTVDANTVGSRYVAAEERHDAAILDHLRADANR